MDNQSIYKLVTKAMSNPFKIIPLLSELLTELNNISEDEKKELYNNYPRLKIILSKII